MTAIRHESSGVALRMRSLQLLRRQGRAPHVGPGVECTGTELGQRLGIAAIFAGRGEQATAAAAALLAIAGVEDSPEARTATLALIDTIAATVRQATDGGPH